MNQSAVIRISKQESFLIKVWELRKSRLLVSALETIKGIGNLLFVASPEQEMIERTRVNTIMLRHPN